MRYTLVNFCEIDKEAAKSYCAIHNADISKNLGNIEPVDERKIKPFNFMVGGTPCQDFSIGGVRQGAVWKCESCGCEYNPLTVKPESRKFCPECTGGKIIKTRSSLLCEWLRILKYVKPDAAVYENVKYLKSKYIALDEKFAKQISVSAVMGYENSLEIAMANDDLIAMRRFANAEMYIKSFQNCADKIRVYKPPQNAQISMFDVDDEDEMFEITM